MFSPRPIIIIIILPLDIYIFTHVLNKLMKLTFYKITASMRREKNHVFKNRVFAMFM